jgi:hypothetical protein
VMGDGEHVNNVFNVGSMEDVGTRMKFLLELYELWLTGIDILDRYDKDTPFYAQKRLELEYAVKLLAYHMEKDYSVQETKDRKIIDSLPQHGDDIPRT